MAKNKGIGNKLSQDFEKNNIRPLTPNEIRSQAGLEGKQFYDSTSYLEPLIDIENNYAKYMGAPKILRQDLEGDLREIRAQNQSFWETAGYGTARFLGNTALHAVGGITAPLSLILSGGKFDNDWNRMIDDAVEGLAELTPMYKTQAQQEADFFSKENLLSDNFWFDDFAGGMSFVAGSYLSGIGLGAIGRATKITQRLMKSSKAMKKSLDATKTAELLSRRMRNINLGQIGLQTTLASYEAGLQAREFKDIALEELRKEHILSQYNDPTEEDLKKYEGEVNKVANGIFAANIALVTMENAVMLNKIYGKPFKRILPQGKPGGIVGNIFDPATKAPTRFAHVVKNMYRTVATPIFEGSQEFAQGFLNEVGVEYVLGKYSPEGHGENYTLGNAVNDAFGKIKGKKGAFDEAYIGMLMGFIGLPVSRATLGSMTNIPKIFSKPAMGEIATAYHKYSAEDSANIMKNTAGHMARVFEINKTLEKAVKEGDMFMAKNEEAKQLLSWMSSRYNAGMLEAEIDNYNDTLDKMTDEEFMSEFGYEGLNADEIRERKKYMKESLNKKRKRFIKAKEIADRITVVSEDQDINELITFNVFMNEDAKDRIEEMENEIYKMTGLRISVSDDDEEKTPTERAQEIGSYFGYKGNLTPDAPKKLKEYMKEPGNFANTVVAIGDHKRLTDARTMYNGNVKSLYDIDNQRKLSDVIRYMKFGLFERFGRATDITKSYIDEWKDLNKIKSELEEELKNYEGIEDLELEVQNEIDYVQSRMDDLQGRVEQRFKSNRMSSSKRRLEVEALIDFIMPEREKFERKYDLYKKFDRGPLITPFGGTPYDGDPDNDDKIFPPPGGSVGKVVRDKTTGRPIFYSIITYDKLNNHVVESFFTRENIEGTNNFVDKPNNNLYSSLLKSLKEDITKGLSKKASDIFDIKVFLQDFYGINEDNFVGLKSVTTVINNANSKIYLVEKNEVVDGENVVVTERIEIDDNFFSALFGIDIRIVEMVDLMNQYNKDEKVIISDDFSIEDHNDKTFLDSDLKNFDDIQVDYHSGTVFKEINGKVQIPLVITKTDPETGEESKIRGYVFLKTTNFTKSNSGSFSKAEKIKKDVMDKYEKDLKELEKMKKEIEKRRYGYGAKGSKNGDSALDC